jgi:hypothetical protein
VTLFIPDISHHQAGIDLHAVKMQGAAALIARVGQGAGRRTNGQQYGTTQDREWVRHRDESRRVGLPLIAYWYVGNLISPEENARLAEAWVGDKNIPWMIDHEDASGNGAFYCATIAAFRARGLRVILGYVPNWYWASAAMGSPDLRCGPPLVNSRYSTASGTASSIYAGAGGDSGRGWVNFGGQTTIMWQFTNQAAFAGKAIDCSAYKGTLADLLAMINGTLPRKDTDMLVLAQEKDGPKVWVGDGITRRHVADQKELEGLQWWIGDQGGNPQVQTGFADIRVLGTDVTAMLAGLADDETKIVNAVRDIVAADANADLEISPEQVQQLADAVVAAVPPHVTEAVRQAFARAGEAPTA